MTRASLAPARTRLVRCFTARDLRPLTSLWATSWRWPVGAVPCPLPRQHGAETWIASLASRSTITLFHEVGLTSRSVLLVTSSGYSATAYTPAVGSFGLGMMAGALSQLHDGSESWPPWSASRLSRWPTTSTAARATDYGAETDRPQLAGTGQTATCRALARMSCGTRKWQWASTTIRM